MQSFVIRPIKFFLIEGIAGSGKTSALLQRIAYLMYRNRKWLDDDQILLFSPNHLFSDYISQFYHHLEKVKCQHEHSATSYKPYYQSTPFKKEEMEEVHFLTGKDNHFKE